MIKTSETSETRGVPDVSEPSALLAQSGGFVTSGGGLPASNEGLIAVVIGVVFGAFCGLIGGFMIAHVSRYLSFLTGRSLWGGRWVLIGAIAGALLFGLKACLDNRE